MKTILITGSSGLIGSEVSSFFAERGFSVHGVDNNQRAAFFGAVGDTRWNQHRLESTLPDFKHHELDVRERKKLLELVDALRPDIIVHAAAQPSHDHAAQIPFDDFDINAGGTLNLLEAARQYCPESPFIHLSTNKVYGDGPNHLDLVEAETRWIYADPRDKAGISETFNIDQSKHSLFGASKASADIYVQEYGRYFSMPTCCLRGGCLTGPNHSGVEMHGFLSHLVRCNLMGETYTVFGYKGKQVRDNIHAADVANFIWAFAHAPRPGEVYNIGGGFENSCSILEAFGRAESVTGKSMRWTYSEKHREGDHICYYSDLNKAKRHFPGWTPSRSLEQIFFELAEGWRQR